MALFSNDTRVVDTSTPTNFVVGASEPNVGQYGWTKTEVAHYNQLIQYVEEVRQSVEYIRGLTSYIQETLKKLEGIDDLWNDMLKLKQDVSDMKDAFETDYKVFLDLYDKFHVHLQAFEVKYNDFLDKYAEVLANAIEAKKSADAAKQSEINAKSSEIEAAKSAQDAADLVARGQIYRGTWKVTPTTVSYPDHKNTNSAWDVILDPADEDTGVDFDGKKWYAGDRLLYIVDSKKYEQVVSGTNVKSVNGKAGAVILSYGDVQAAPEGFGLGGNGARCPGEHVDNALQSGFYAIYSGTEGTPDTSGKGPSGSRMIVSTWSDKHVTQLFFRVNSTRMYLRSRVVDNNDPSGYAWTAWEEVYSTSRKPSASDVGAVSKAGDTMSGDLKLQKGLHVEGVIANPKFTHDNKQILNGGATQVYLGNRDGVSELHLQTNNGNAFVSQGPTNHRIYHQGYKPSAGDINAVSKTGDTMTGGLKIQSPSSHLDLIETDQDSKTWRLESQSKTFQFTEVGQAVRLALYEGGGAALSGEFKNTGGEIKSKNTQSYRMSDGIIGTFWRKDGDNLYLMRTEENQAESGGWSSHRPFAMELKTGKISMGNGATVKDELTMAGKLRMTSNYLMGSNDNIMLRDHGNGNVTLSASKNNDGVSGELYLGFNGAASGTAGYNTKNVRLESRMNWKNLHTLVDADGKINSEAMAGPIRTEKDAGGVYHTIVGGADTINRGRTIIAAGEAGKVLYDNTPTSAEDIHLGADGNAGFWVHTGLQNGWGSSTHKKVKFENGEMYAVDGTKRVYHTGYKPSAADVGALPNTGGTVNGGLVVRDQVVVGTGDYRARIVESSTRMYYQGGKADGDETDQKMVLSGYIGKGLTELQLYMKADTTPVVKWGSTVHKIYHEGYKPAGGISQGDFGIGGRQGAAAMANDYTEDKSRDFNKLIVAGEYTTDNEWANGTNNVPEPQGHTGMVKVEVRNFGSGSSYVQTFKSGTEDTVNMAMRFGTGTYPNIDWKPWRRNGNWEVNTAYRMTINRKGQNTYPYFTISKAEKRTDLTSGYYTTGSIEFKESPTDEKNPATGRPLVIIRSDTYFDQSRNRGVFQVRRAADDSTASEVVLYEDNVQLNNRGKSVIWDSVDLKVDGKKVYHEGYKPTLTAADVGALPLTGGTLTGSLTSPGFRCSAGGNAFTTGATTDGAYLSLSAESGYTMMWRRNDSTTKADEFIGISSSGRLQFRQDNGTGDRKYTDHMVYHTGHKPSAADMNVVSKTGDTMTGPLDLNITQHAAITMNSNLDSGTYIVGQAKGSASWSVGCANNSGDIIVSNDKHDSDMILKSGGAEFNKNLSVNGAITLNGKLNSNALASTNKQILNANSSDYVYLGNPTVKRVNIETDASGELWVNAGGTNRRVYHTGWKPTAADVEAISTSSGTMSGKLLAKDVEATLIHRNGYMLMKPYSSTYDDGSYIRAYYRAHDNGKPGVGWKGIQWDAFNTSTSTGENFEMKLGQNFVYHQGRKPSAADVGAVPASDVSTTSTWDGLINKIPKISSSGVLEVGRYIDFHTNNSTKDFDMRMDCPGSGRLKIVGGKFEADGGVYLTTSNAPWGSYEGSGGICPTVDTINVSDGAWYPMITSPSHVRVGGGADGWSNRWSIGHYRTNGANNGDFVINMTGDGLLGKNLRFHFTSSGGITNGASTHDGSSFSVHSDGRLQGNWWGGAAGTSGEYLDAWIRTYFQPISDVRYKCNIAPSTKSALSDVSRIHFHEYDWVEDNITKALKPTKLGMIAQELEEIDPAYTRDVENFKKDEDGNNVVDLSTKSLDIANLLALSLKANQELLARIEALEAKLS